MSTFMLILLCLLIFVIGIFAGMALMQWLIIEGDIVIIEEEDTVTVGFKHDK